MRSPELLFLSSLLFCGGLTKVHSTEVVIEAFTGTLAEDSLVLPPQTRRLEIRWVDSNQTVDIETGAVCTASTLRTVKLDFTTAKPPILRQDMFENCENLTEVVLNGKAVHASELKAEVCRNFLNVDNFEANYFKIHRLTRDFFTGMNSLSRLVLRGCDIEEIELGALDELENLEILSLESNKMTVLPMILFKNLLQIKKVNLARNQISGIEWDGFDGLLSSLEELNLRFNRLTSLDVDKIAKYMPNVKNIIIHHNAMNCTTKEKFAQQLGNKLNRTVDVMYFDLIYFDYGANCQLEEEFFAHHKVQEGVQWA